MILEEQGLKVLKADSFIEIVSVPGVKNMLFGGEGVFNTVVKGPGKIILQTMPINNVAGCLRPFLPAK